ncbi:MAG: 30S ribosome-binding factor RbfA [Bacteroidales bacterium]|jgi:ribosome-binding factor A|nr:30S ribosome-binding factor RbfA [Bacteroidales bacterium]
METTRQQKVARQVQKDLSEILQYAGKDVTPGKMVTITRVRMSPDLALAKIYFSVFPSENADKSLTQLQKHVKRIRLELGRKVRHQLRIVPELAFFIDDSMDYAQHIDELLNK